MIEIIAQYDNQDFCFLEGADCDDKDIRFKLEPQHGTIVIVKGLVEEDETAVFPMGTTDKEIQNHAGEFRVAFWKPFTELYPDGKISQGG